MSKGGGAVDSLSPKISDRRLSPSPGALAASVAQLAPLSSGGEIVDLDAAWRRLLDYGVVPFLQLLESGSKEFFRPKDFITLYDLVVALCVQKEPYSYSEALYERVVHSVLDYMYLTVLPSLKSEFSASSRSRSPEQLLRLWVTRWDSCKLLLHGLCKLFAYLERYFIANTDGLYTIKEFGMRLYKEIVFEQMKVQVRALITQTIDRDRDGLPTEVMTIKESIGVFLELGYYTSLKSSASNNRDRPGGGVLGRISSFNSASKAAAESKTTDFLHPSLPMMGSHLYLYSEEFEEDFLRSSSEYYARLAPRLVEESTVSTYLTRVEKILKDERERCENVLHRSSNIQLQKLIYRELLAKPAIALLRKKGGLGDLMREKKTDELKRVYRLYVKESGGREIGALADAFLLYVSQQGEQILLHAHERNESFVQELVEVHTFYHSIVTTCFENNPRLKAAVKSAFERCINENHEVTAKLLAKFTNDLLKKNSRVRVENRDETLENIVLLYSYIKEKDLFERDYQLFLSYRLLTATSENEHSERSIIAKLKVQSGYQWTYKLEGMFKDVQHSKQLLADFRRTAPLDKDDIELDVLVGTTGFWPLPPCSRSNMHPSISATADKFRNFYLKVHNGHKLEWRHDQGSAEVQVAFNLATVRTLVVSTYQMLILLIFNSFKSVDLKTIVRITGISKNELTNAVLSLCHPKVGVLLKHPNTVRLDDDDKFAINSKFKSSLLKVIIPTLHVAAGKAAGEAAGPTDEQSVREAKVLELQRRHQVDASIVRIMKSRKTLNAHNLAVQVIEQLAPRFKPKPADIKKRIEALIEQEYLKRDENDRESLQYIS